MAQQNSKKPELVKRCVLFGLIVCLLLTLSYGASNEQDTAKITIAALTQEAANARQSIDELYQKDLKTQTLLKDIAQLNAQIASIKNQTGISALETQLNGIKDQLNQGAVNLWAQAVDNATHVNLNTTINNALNWLLTDDPAIKENIEKISMLNKEIGERIAQKGWVKAIQTLGAAIESTAPNELKQVALALSAYQAAQAQILTVRNSNPILDKTLLPLEIELAAQQLNLKNKLSQSPQLYQQLLRYKNELKKLKFIFETMQNPSTAIHMNQEFLTNYETSSNDAIV